MAIAAVNLAGHTEVLGRIDLNMDIYELTDRGMELFEIEDRIHDLILRQKDTFKCKLKFNNQEIKYSRPITDGTL